MHLYIVYVTLYIYIYYTLVEEHVQLVVTRESDVPGAKLEVILPAAWPDRSHHHCCQWKLYRYVLPPPVSAHPTSREREVRLYIGVLSGNVSFTCARAMWRGERPLGFC